MKKMKDPLRNYSCGSGRMWWTQKRSWKTKWKDGLKSLSRADAIMWSTDSERSVAVASTPLTPSFLSSLHFARLCSLTSLRPFKCERTTLHCSTSEINSSRQQGKLFTLISLYFSSSDLPQRDCQAVFIRKCGRVIFLSTAVSTSFPLDLTVLLKYILCVLWIWLQKHNQFTSCGLFQLFFVLTQNQQTKDLDSVFNIQTPTKRY